MTDCPVEQVATVLQIPEDDFGKDAVAWNVAVHSAATALSGSNTPRAMLNAACQGKLVTVQLVLCMTLYPLLSLQVLAVWICKHCGPAVHYRLSVSRAAWCAMRSRH